jgi:3-keto-disaccharide hydrolase
MRKTLFLLSCSLAVTVLVIAGCSTSTSRRSVDRAKVELKSQLKPEIKREVGWELRRDMEYTLTNKFKTQMTAEMRKEIAAQISQLTNEMLIQLRSEIGAYSAQAAPAPSYTPSSVSSSSFPTKSSSTASSSTTSSSHKKPSTSSSSTSSPYSSSSSTSASPRPAPAPAPAPMTTTTEVGANGEPANVTLFNGKTLDGWVPYQGNLSQFSGADFVDFAVFAKKILAAADPISAFINQRLDEAVKTDLASYNPDAADAKTVKTAFVHNLSKIVAAKKSIYESGLFQNVQLRPQTEELLRNKKLKGQDITRLNKMLIEDAYPKDIAHSTSVAWVVKNDALASTGEGRGLIYTKDDYSHFRLTFLTRHTIGQPDHPASVLIFCSRPADGDRPLDNLGGIQFQMPNGGHWDYRPGHNEAGKGEFKTIIKPDFNPNEWCQVEIVANSRTGLARMAVAQPPGSRAVEVTDFTDPSAGKPGPIALQMHNGGLLDEYKDLKIELNPKSDDLVTTGSSGTSLSAQSH